MENQTEEKHTAFINALNEYEEARKNRRRELERKAHRLTDALLKIWETANPRPKLEELKTLKTEGNKI